MKRYLGIISCLFVVGVVYSAPPVFVVNPITVSGSTIAVNNFPATYPLPSTQVTDLKAVTVSNAFASESTLTNIDGNITKCDTDNIGGSITVSNMISGFATELTVSSMNSKITACDTGNIAGSVSVSNITTCDTSNIGGTITVSNFPATQTVADERYQTKVSTGSAGKLVASGQISISYEVTEISFLAKGGEVVITATGIDGTIYVPENNGVSMEFKIPINGMTIDATLDGSDILYYTITGVK